MRILILDDDEFRHKFYKRVYSKHDVTHAYTYYEFLRHLDHSSPWDLIHLDHDLGDLQTGDTYVDGWGARREFNGGHASMRICELDDDRLPTQVLIQSVNPDGARVMRSNLQQRGVAVKWVPFGESTAVIDTGRNL